MGVPEQNLPWITESMDNGVHIYVPWENKTKKTKIGVSPFPLPNLIFKFLSPKAFKPIPISTGIHGETSLRMQDQLIMELDYIIF